MIRPLLRSFVAVLGLACVAQAAPVLYTANLSGANEVPPNASTGTGFAAVTLDLAANTLRIQVSFSDLIGTTTAAHIHAPGAAGMNVPAATQVPTFINFPLGVTSGSYDMTFDTTLTSTFNPAFVTNNGGTAASATAALATALNAGLAYMNVHTSTFGGGEIRGQLRAVPEPATLALGGLGAVAGLVIAARRRRRVRVS
jgi:hypothetical protein